MRRGRAEVEPDAPLHAATAQRLQAQGGKITLPKSVAEQAPKDTLVVSVSNRTVVTAVDRAGMQGNVFTKIDSAVIV